MSRRFCLLPQGFSEACAIDCVRHVHLSLREVKERETGGDIELLDVHPITKLARYVLRIHPTHTTHIAAPVIEAAVGAYKWHSSELRSARRKIKSHVEEDREFLRLIPQCRDVTLPKVKWTEDGLVGNYKSDGERAAKSFNKQKGHGVRVALKPRTPEALEAALDYSRFIGLVQHDLLNRSNPGRPPKAMRKSFFQDQLKALARLDAAWPEIVAGFFAGPYSETLNEMRASELPSMVFHKTLREYLRTVEK